MARWGGVNSRLFPLDLPSRVQPLAFSGFTKMWSVSFQVSPKAKLKVPSAFWVDEASVERQLNLEWGMELSPASGGTPGELGHRQEDDGRRKALRGVTGWVSYARQSTILVSWGVPERQARLGGALWVWVLSVCMSRGRGERGGGRGKRGTERTPPRARPGQAGLWGCVWWALGWGWAGLGGRVGRACVFLR